MKKLLKFVILALLIIAIIFTTGIDTIEQNNNTTELQNKEVKEEKNIEQETEEAIKETNKNETKEEPKISEGEKEENPENEKQVEKSTEKKDIKDNDKGEDKKAGERPLNIVLNDAEALIEDSIRLGSSKDPKGKNYMSEATGGNGNYTYEWRIKGSDRILSKEKNPSVNPDSDTQYELTLKDSDGSSIIVEMFLRVLDPKGSIVIKTQAVGSKNEKFDIFISGPNRSLYTVRLRNGESIKLNNLKRGSYSVSTIVPMNYKLSYISNKNINLSLEGLDKETTVNYERTNTSWFYSP